MILHNIQILSTLAAGSYATAYLAKQVDVGRKVVVKVAHPHLMHSQIGEMIRTRFQQELKVMAMINHPNLVTLFSAGDTHDGLPALVMEYVEGQSLSALLSQHAPLNWDLCQDLFQQLFRAISALHAIDIIHRDITPHNIIISKTHKGHPLLKLLDFGVAQLDNISNGTLGPIGTPRYLAPEQIQGRALPASDLFSIGALLWWALTGTEFMCDICSATDYIVQILAMTSAPDPRTLNPHISPAAASIVSRLLHPDPLARPTLPQLQSIWDDLNGFQSSFTRTTTASQSSSSPITHTSLPIPPPSPSTQPASPNILILDALNRDAPFVAKTLSQYLCNLTSVSSISDAANALNDATTPFDIILFSRDDLDFSGPDIIQWLRSSLGELSLSGPGIIMISYDTSLDPDLDPDAFLNPNLGSTSAHSIISQILEHKNKTLRPRARKTSPLMPISLASPSPLPLPASPPPLPASPPPLPASPPPPPIKLSTSESTLHPNLKRDFIGKLPDLLIDLSDDAADHHRRIQICKYIENLTQQIGSQSLTLCVQRIASLPPETPAAQVNDLIEALEAEYTRVFRSLL